MGTEMTDPDDLADDEGGICDRCGGDLFPWEDAGDGGGLCEDCQGVEDHEF